MSDNKARNDSYARDHLSNERTFLSWLRTALALMGFGVLIARLRWIVPNTPATAGAISALDLGLWLSGVGLLMIPYALWHYFATRRAVDEDRFQSLGASIVVFAVAIGIAGVGIMIYLYSSPPTVAPITNLP